MRSHLTKHLLAMSFLSLLSASAWSGEHQQLQVGAFHVTVIDDKATVFSAELFAQEAALPQYAPYFAEGPVPGTMRAYLVTDGEHTILIDSGNGSAGGGTLLKTLQELGVEPAAVTDILLTHFDGDHISGLMEEAKAVFPAAQVHASQAEYQGWIEEGTARAPQAVAKARDILGRYAEHLSLFAFGEEVLPGITARGAVGHTIGHTRFDLDSQGESLTVIGDLLHAYPLQLHHPEVSSAYDQDKEQAAKTRAETLQELTDAGRTVAGMHIVPIGKLKARAEGGYEFAE